ncbi:MAG: hypothetical protein LBN95_02070 [Prevotellaceae bacterium]|jgi:hypothetical protein|nr:hypothetical protein [Prevotellaceae bacterium]
MNIEKKIKKRRTMIIYIFIFLSMPAYLFTQCMKDSKEEKMLQNYGVNTKCQVFAYAEGKSGVRGPKQGYYNKCWYIIGDSVHYCWIFTSKKHLPDVKIALRYVVLKNGKVKINFPETEVNKYKEYGFNDYGY